MTLFAILSNQIRETQRPPRLGSRANADLLARLVPIRVPKRKPVQHQIPADPDPSAVRRPGRRSPLVQAPVNGFHFSDASNRRNHAVHQNNGKSYPYNGQSSVTTLQGLLENEPGVPEERNGARKIPSAPPEKKLAPQPRIENPPPSSNLKEPVLKAVLPVPQPGKPQVSLLNLLEKNTNLPGQAVILGVCEDGLPLTLDLTDPSPGSLLAMGDVREEQIQLLRAAVASAALRNSPRAVQFLVFSHQPEPWRAWVIEHGFDRHCLAIEEAQEDAVREWIVRLADWTEQRRLGQRSGPPVLLVIDTLTFLPRLAYDIRLNFDWMVKEGPPAQIWTLAAISTDLAASLGIRMLRSFQSRILGCAKDPAVFSRLAGLDEQQAAVFNQPGQFAVQVGDRWLHFQLPVF